VVTLVKTIYHTGVKLTQQAMVDIDELIHRLPTLKKWFVEIFCRSNSRFGSFFSWYILEDYHSTKPITENLYNREYIEIF
jgi:hypothetical protein